MSISTEELKENAETLPKCNRLNLDDYLYHSIGGFDLYKLDSILKHGILSLNKSKEKGIRIGTFGKGENGSSNISVSTADVLSTNSYSGCQLSIIIDPKKLKIINPQDYPEQFTIRDDMFFQNCTSIQGPDPSNCPNYERQICDEITKDNIIGVMIPSSYLSLKLDEIHILNEDHPNIKIYAINLINLNRFFRENKLPSIFSDKSVDEYFAEMLSMKIKTDERRSEFRERKKETIHNLNHALMVFVAKIYKKLLGKESIGILDILNYHLKFKCQIYSTKGELLDCNAIDANLIEKSFDDRLNTVENNLHRNEKEKVIASLGSPAQIIEDSDNIIEIQTKKDLSEVLAEGYKYLEGEIKRMGEIHYSRPHCSRYGNAWYDRFGHLPCGSVIDEELLRAAEKLDFKKMDSLLEIGADPALSACVGIPVIYILCSSAQFQAAKYLFEKKPMCINAKTFQGYSAFYAATVGTLRDVERFTSNESLPKGEEALRKARIEFVSYIVNSNIQIDFQMGIPAKRPANITKDEDDAYYQPRTILHACQDPEILKIILKCKPNPFIKDYMKRTPLESMKDFVQFRKCQGEEYERHHPPYWEMWNEVIGLFTHYEIEYKQARQAEKLQLVRERWNLELNYWLHSKDYSNDETLEQLACRFKTKLKTDGFLNDHKIPTESEFIALKTHPTI